MEPSGDELAGIADLFGGLTRAELGQALVELAFRTGDDRDPAHFDDDIDAAIAGYSLVAVDRDGGAESGDDQPEELLVPGPVAFPELPEHAMDLPHIMDVEERYVDRERVGEAAEARFRADTARAVADGDEARMADLLDVSYELEAWAPVDLGETRSRLDDALS
jgi:hypothetical protein